VCGLGTNEQEEDDVDTEHISVSDPCTATISEEVIFSEEEEKLYSRRYENGYDLYDPKYIRWLSINHPLADIIRSNEPVADLFTTQVVTPVHIDLPACNTGEENGTTIDTRNSTLRHHSVVVNEHPPTDLATTPVSTSSNSRITETAVKCSPLADLVNTPRTNKDKQLKTGYARVLTSTECIKAFEEKEERKRVAEEEKQKRKAERELKKKQEEQEMQRKKEEKAQKAATKVAKQREKEASKQQQQSKQAKSNKRRTESTLTSRSKKNKIQESADDEIDCNRCCTCFGLFGEDLGTERERWIHEDCIDEDDVNGDATKLCPLC